jgi:DNA-binding YbaB/EbfC family protein
MSGPDMKQMLEQAQQMQQRIGDLQRDLAMRRYEASSGGGMVIAVVSGQLRVLEIKIEPSLVENRDREMIQDLTAAAVNSALEKAQRGAQEEFARLGGGLNIPGLPGSG